MIKAVFGAFRLFNLQVVMIHVFSELVKTGHVLAISRPFPLRKNPGRRR